jgi:hypothetical protein
MKMYSMTTYLTEKPLGDILRAWAGAENVTAQPLVSGTRMRHDYEVRKDGITYSVEFNGDSHYRDPSVIFRDYTKEDLSKKLGRKVVQIPYFIQLNSETFKTFFGVDFDIETTFPHGFVATKMLPSSFCPLGYDRALYELKKHSKGVNADVMKSLEAKAEKLCNELVYYTNFIKVDGKDMSWNDFVDESNLVHDNKYYYPHPL